MTPEYKHDLEVEGGRIILELEKIEVELKNPTSPDVKHTWEEMKAERAKRFLEICDLIENETVLA